MLPTTRSSRRSCSCRACRRTTCPRATAQQVAGGYAGVDAPDDLESLVVLEASGGVRVESIAFATAVSEGLARAMAGLPDDAGAPVSYPDLLHGLEGAAIEVTTRGKRIKGRLVDLEGPFAPPTAEKKEKPEPEEGDVPRGAPRREGGRPAPSLGARAQRHRRALARRSDRAGERPAVVVPASARRPPLRAARARRAHRRAVDRSAAREKDGRSHVDRPRWLGQPRRRGDRRVVWRRRPRARRHRSGRRGHRRRRDRPGLAQYDRRGARRPRGAREGGERRVGRVRRALGRAARQHDEPDVADGRRVVLRRWRVRRRSGARSPQAEGSPLRRLWRRARRGSSIESE